MDWMQELEAKVAEQTTVVSGVKAAFEKLRDEMNAPGVDIETARKMVAQIAENTDILKAVKDNTAAEEEDPNAVPDSVWGDKEVAPVVPDEPAEEPQELPGETEETPQ